MSLDGSPAGSSPSEKNIGSTNTLQFDDQFWNRLTGANKEMVDDAVDRVKASMEVIVDEKMRRLREEFQQSLGDIKRRTVSMEQQRALQVAADRRLLADDDDGDDRMGGAERT